MYGSNTLLGHNSQLFRVFFSGWPFRIRTLQILQTLQTLQTFDQTKDKKTKRTKENKLASLKATLVETLPT